MATWKNTVRAATTANITLSGTQTIDGVELVADDRVLVKNQLIASQNGIYAVASGAAGAPSGWSRTSDASSAIEPEMVVRVSEGRANAHSEWALLTQAPINVGTTELVYASLANSIIFVSPKMFGCPWDGVHDDLPGFLAMQSAIAPAFNAVRVDLPPGTGYFSDDLHLNRPLEIVGRSGGSEGLDTVMQFAPGKGVICDGNYSGGGGSNHFAGGLISRVAIFSTQMVVGNTGDHFLGDLRQASKCYEKGNGVIASGGMHPTLFFRVTTAGITSAGGEPSWNLTIGGTTPDDGTDGTVTWTTEGIVQVYESNHCYTAGERIQVKGDVRYYWECTHAGTSGMSPPSEFKAGSDGVSIGSVVNDGPNLQWVTKVHACVLSKDFHRMSDFHLEGATCFAWHIQSDLFGPSKADICDFMRGERGTIYLAAGGILTSGTDVTAGSFRDIQTSNIGSGRDNWVLDTRLGSGGITIYEDGFGGNLWEGCYAQDGVGPMIYMPSGHKATFIHCQSENAYKDIVLSPAMVIQRGYTDYADESTAIIIDSAPGAGQNLKETIRGTPQLQAGMSLQDASRVVHWFTSEDEATGQNLGWSYQSPLTLNSPVGTGWLGLSFLTQNGRVCVGVSGSKAVEGPGHWREYEGAFVGTDSEVPRYNGISQIAINDKSIRGGTQLVGDKFRFQSTGTAGVWEEYVAAAPSNADGIITRVAGYRGVRYVPENPVVAAYAPFGIFGDVIEPSTNDFPIPSGDGTPGTGAYLVTAITSDGKLPSPEPVWAMFYTNPGDTHTFSNGTGGTVTLQYLGQVPKYVRSTFIDDPVVALTPQTDCDWNDTAATDPGTTASKARVRTRRRSFQTTTNSLDQVLLTTPILTENATTVVDVVVCGKKNGAAEAVSCKLSGTYYRHLSGAPQLLGSVDNVVKGTTGIGSSIFSLAINAKNEVQILTTPGANVTIDWGITAQLTEGRS